MIPLLMLALAHAQGVEDPPRPDLTGTWKLTLRVANKAQIPLLGETTVWSVSTYVADVSADADGSLQHHVLCEIDSRSSRRIAEHVLPLAFVAAMPQKTYPLGLVQVGQDLTYTADLGHIYIGFDPEQTDGLLPDKDLDTDQLQDWDGDGQVGATVLLKVPLLGVVEVYMIQRAHTLIHGTVVSDDLVYGRVELPILEQRIVDASNLLMRGNPRTDPDPANSSFRMVRLPRGTTCDDLGLPKPRPEDFR